MRSLRRGGGCGRRWLANRFPKLVHEDDPLSTWVCSRLVRRIRFAASAFSFLVCVMFVIRWRFFVSLVVFVQACRSLSVRLLLCGAFLFCCRNNPTMRTPGDARTPAHLLNSVAYKHRMQPRGRTDVTRLVPYRYSNARATAVHRVHVGSSCVPALVVTSCAVKFGCCGFARGRPEVFRRIRVAAFDNVSLSFVGLCPGAF